MKDTTRLNRLKFGPPTHVTIAGNNTRLRFKWVFQIQSQPTDHHVVALKEYRNTLLPLFGDCLSGPDSDLSVYPLLYRTLRTPCPHKPIFDMLGGEESVHISPWVIRSLIIGEYQRSLGLFSESSQNIFFVSTANDHGEQTFIVVCLHMHESEWWMSFGHSMQTEQYQRGTRIFLPATVTT